MRIEWSEQSIDDLENILQYVIDNFGDKVAYRVNNEINDVVDSLARFPMMGIVLYHNKTKDIIHRTLSMKYYKIVYYTKGDALKIEMLWSNYRDGKTLKKLLSNNE